MMPSRPIIRLSFFVPASRVEIPAPPEGQWLAARVARSETQWPANVVFYNQAGPLALRRRCGR